MARGVPSHACMVSISLVMLKCAAAAGRNQGQRHVRGETSEAIESHGDSFELRVEFVGSMVVFEITG